MQKDGSDSITELKTVPLAQTDGSDSVTESKHVPLTRRTEVTALLSLEVLIQRKCLAKSSQSRFRMTVRHLTERVMVAEVINFHL